VYTGATLPGREMGGVEYDLVAEHYHGKVFCGLYVGIVPSAESSNHGIALCNFCQGQEAGIKSTIL